jgi:hypothetical protein
MDCPSRLHAAGGSPLGAFDGVLDDTLTIGPGEGGTAGAIVPCGRDGAVPTFESSTYRPVRSTP